uniref:MADF domain-containing protein n=1 Tax=Heliothis virescens TaxID=7102 RepID=A0A2A4IU44_HELVI
MLADKMYSRRRRRGDETREGRGTEPAPRAPHPTRSVTCAPRRSSNAYRSNKMSDAVNIVFPRKLVKEFITLYQNLPCLWDKYCISYKMKYKRHEAITKLTQLVQEYDPSATRVHVLRKIESLRACVRREHKRVEHSKKIAETEADIYTPHLWYYDLFSFIFRTDEINEEYNKEKPSASSPQQTIVDSEPEEEEEEEDDAQEDDGRFDTTADTYSSPAFSISSNIVEVPESTSKRFLEDDKNKRHCTEVDDEYDAIGVNVAAKLRNLPGNMRILAEKLINDVLFQAQTNGLTNSTYITTPDPFKM